MMKEDSQATVCVTGATGFIGSWLVMRLLERGYTVHATVRDPGDIKKVNHLVQLPKADTNLKLWKADLTQEGSFDEAIKGCHGVFHVATPMDFESKDPENEIIKPTIEGVLSIIRSCVKAKTVKKLVYTSTAGTVNVEEHQHPVYDETHWSDLDFIYSKKMTAWVCIVVRIHIPSVFTCSRRSFRLNSPNGLCEGRRPKAYNILYGVVGLLQMVLKPDTGPMCQQGCWAPKGVDVRSHIGWGGKLRMSYK